MFSNASSSWDLPDEDFERPSASSASAVTSAIPADDTTASSALPVVPPPTTTVGDTPTSAQASTETNEFEHHPSKVFGIFGNDDPAVKPAIESMTPEKKPDNAPFSPTKPDESDIDFSSPWNKEASKLPDDVFEIPNKEADLTDKINPDDFFHDLPKDPKIEPKPETKPFDSPKPFAPPAPRPDRPSDDSALRQRLDDLRTKTSDTTKKISGLVEELNGLLKQTTDAITETERRNEELKRNNEELDKKHKRLTDLINQAKADLV